MNDVRFSPTLRGRIQALVDEMRILLDESDEQIFDTITEYNPEFTEEETQILAEILGIA